MRDFPQGKFDDAPDCLEMVVELAQKPKGQPQVFIIDGRIGGGRRGGFDDYAPFYRALRG